jgi:hypothetical protein
MAFFHAYFQGDLPAAREILARTPEDSLNRDTRLRARRGLKVRHGTFTP